MGDNARANRESTAALMSVFGISMCKDEADIVEPMLRHMASQVDALIVSDNGSTDGTRDILSDLFHDLPLTILDDADVAYYQSAKMSRLAELAAEQGATWVVPHDFDEIWYSPFGRLADVLAQHTTTIVMADSYDHVATGVDPEGDPVKCMGWRRRDPLPLPKVAVKALPGLSIHQGNHGASYVIGTHPSVTEHALTIRHFPIRSLEQMIRKARNGGRAYEATDLPPEVGAHWRGWNSLSDEQLDEVFHEFYWYEHPETNDSLIFDPAPCA